MRIIVLGNVAFTLEMLKTLKAMNAKVVGVITGLSSGINSDYCDLSPFCEQEDIPCFKTDSVNQPEVQEWVKSQNADVIFCLGWSRLIKKELLESVPNGVIGFHPAKLPQNRGRHPLIWALALGLKETATTFFMMDEGADSGDIVSQKTLPINEEDDAASLYLNMIENAKTQLISIVEQLSQKKLKPIPQDEQCANTWRKRGMCDGEIDWRMSAVSIHNLIRALTKPYVGAHFVHRGKEHKVWKSEQVEAQDAKNLEAGKVIALDREGVCIKCGDGAVRLLSVEPPIELSVGDYL